MLVQDMLPEVVRPFPRALIRWMSTLTKGTTIFLAVARFVVDLVEVSFKVSHGCKAFCEVFASGNVAFVRLEVFVHMLPTSVESVNEFAMAPYSRATDDTYFSLELFSNAWLHSEHLKQGLPVCMSTVGVFLLGPRWKPPIRCSIRLASGDGDMSSP